MSQQYRLQKIIHLTHTQLDWNYRKTNLQIKIMRYILKNISHQSVITSLTTKAPKIMQSVDFGVLDLSLYGNAADNAIQPSPSPLFSTFKDLRHQSKQYLIVTQTYNFEQHFQIVALDIASSTIEDGILLLYLSSDGHQNLYNSLLTTLLPMQQLIMF